MIGVDEMIARQARQIEALRDRVTDLEERHRQAKRYIYCIGGPLNDNRLKYSGAQMATFQKIADALGN